MNSALLVRNLSKSYAHIPVLKDVSIDIPNGKIIGLIGKNGSGKSTLIKCMLHLIPFEEGVVHILNTDSNKTLGDDIGFYIPEANFYPNFSGKQNLSYFLGVEESQLSSFNDLFRSFLMSEAMEKKYRAYSLGMKQRFGLMFTLIQKKQYYLFDEPISSLDHQGQLIFNEVIKKKAREDNCGILIVSHQLEVLESFCDEIYMMNDCEIKQLTSSKTNHIYRLAFADQSAAKMAVEQIGLTVIFINDFTIELELSLENEIESVIQRVSSLHLRQVIKVQETLAQRYENALGGETHEK